MENYFGHFGFVSGVILGLVFGGLFGCMVSAMLGWQSDKTNEVIVSASYQMPIGFVLVMYVYLGRVLIKVSDIDNNDTGFVDNPDLDLDVRLALAEAHAINVEKNDKIDMSLKDLIVDAEKLEKGLAA